MNHPTGGLDDVVHQRNRLGIMAVLVDADSVDFTYLKESLSLTAGNLSRHLGVLVDAGLVSVDKKSGPRTRTWVTITKSGRRAFRKEIDALRTIVESSTTSAAPDQAPHRA